MLKLEPKLSDVIAFGTDGEQAIVKAVRATFPERIIHLRCFIHMKDNIRRKLTELLLPELIREEIIRDIFGFHQGAISVKGILDASDSTDFDRRLLHLKIKWDEFEKSAHSHQDPLAHQWIVDNVSDVMKESMILPVRELAGLGSPPITYTTNRNESMNNVAKLQADYQKSSWVQLTHNMFDLVMAQSNEVEKAVIGMGECRFKPAYKQIEISCNKWFMMSPEQRKSHMRKVFAMECTPVESEVTLNNFDVNRRILSLAPERCGIAIFHLKYWK